MKRNDAILLPGWGIAPELYPNFGQSRTIDYGFFSDTGFSFNNPDLNLPDEPIILFAHSLGSLLALRTALENPERVHAMVLFCPFPRFIADENWPGQSVGTVRSMKMPLGMAPGMVLSRFYEALDAGETKLSPPSKINSGQLGAGLDFLINTDLRDSLTEISIPTLIIHGQSDKIVSPELGKRLARAMPESEFQEIAGAGHALPFSHREICQGAGKAFLDAYSN